MANENENIQNNTQTYRQKKNNARITKFANA